MFRWSAPERWSIPGTSSLRMTTASALCPADNGAAVLEAAKARIDAEETKRTRLAAGELGIDLYGMRPRLAEKGLKYA